MTVYAKDLREGDQIPLVTLTIGSVMELAGSVYVQFTDNERVEVFAPDVEIEIIREEG